MTHAKQAGPPRVFVSSTVFDFRDLRSAIKYWLTELGYDPQLSEYNDFVKPLDQDSYSACLRTVETSDYFVLLSGSRVGGFYDNKKQISITRQEYRHAYEAFQATGRPRIITFVRTDLWSVRTDRAALEKLLSQLIGQKESGHDTSSKGRRGSLGGAAKRIANHSSPIVENAAAIFSFLDEVKRKDEMVAATAEGKGFPAGNWVHTFDGFDDIVAVLRNELRARSVGRAAIETNLRAELLNVAESLTTRVGPRRSITPEYERVARLRPLLGSNFDATLSVTGRDLADAGAFWTLGSVAGASLGTTSLEHAIHSGEFLEWQSEVHAFVPTAAQRALLRLRAEIVQLRRMADFASAEFRDAVATWINDWRAREHQVQSVPAYLLVPVMALHDRHSNILDLTAAIHSVLEGDASPCDRLVLWAPTPLGAEREELRARAGGRVRLQAWLAQRAQEIPLGSQLRQQQTEQ